jgi:DNA repair protein RecO (recombination protein O)
VLRGRQLGEADRILTLLTTERGKLDAVAKGVRRAGSHLAGRLEFGNECEFSMHRGRSLDVVVAADIVSAPWADLVQPERFAVASLAIELVDAFCEPDLAVPDVYALLAGTLLAIARSDAPQSVVPRFSLRLLEVLGLGPPPDDCVRCGSTLGDGVAYVDAQAGGFIDDRCRERWRDLPALTLDERQNFRAVGAERGAGATMRAYPPVAAAIDDLMAHHLGHRPKSGAQFAELAPP